MFKLKFSKMYDNNIYTKYNIKPVVEDYFLVKDNVFCIADGITKDLVTREVTKYPTCLEEIENIISKYPNPSGSYEAAKICAETFIKELSDKSEINKDIIFNAVKTANNNILKLNENRIINYLEEDFHCCVAVGGIIIRNKLICFSIGDCSIILLDSNFNNIFSTPKTEEFICYENYLKKMGFKWNSIEYRYMRRKFFRNNPYFIENGKNISYGVLTGEKTAEEFIRIYEIDLKDVKYICAFSDGCEQYFEDKKNIKEVITNPEYISQKGEERTLIIYEDEE